MVGKSISVRQNPIVVATTSLVIGYWIKMKQAHYTTPYLFPTSVRCSGGAFRHIPPFGIQYFSRQYQKCAASKVLPLAWESATRAMDNHGAVQSTDNYDETSGNCPSNSFNRPSSRSQCSWKLKTTFGRSAAVVPTVATYQVERKQDESITTRVCIIARNNHCQSINPSTVMRNNRWFVLL